LTVLALCAFVGLGLILLTEINAAGEEYHRLLLGFLLVLPVPVLPCCCFAMGQYLGACRNYCTVRGRRWLPETAASVDRVARLFHVGLGL
jgi:hypothetical protein